MGIDEWRREIDNIDREMLRLLSMRARLALKLGVLKTGAGLPLCDPDREREVLTEACRRNVGPLDDRAVARIFRRIIHESKRLETTSLDGSKQAHSEEAV
jgi:chorismate mutase